MSPKVTDEFFDYSNSPYYVLDSWLSEEAYFTTAYFVDTAIICNGGRYTASQIYGPYKPCIVTKADTWDHESLDHLADLTTYPMTIISNLQCILSSLQISW